jgi:(Z)-2-((N-methylformamido)methylene)-5-hydroxybutyrolactone dehydrogenase
MQSDTNIGPITTPAQYKKVLDYIEIAKAEGARCLLGGKPAVGEGIVGGQFVEPTIFTDVDNKMRIAREEVFGPVLSIISSDTEEDAIRIANDTIYGLRQASGPPISRVPCACQGCCAPEPCG